MSSLLHAKGAAWPVELCFSHFGYPLDNEMRTALVAWLDLLAIWNAKLDLTAARSEGELIDLMLADALVLAKSIPTGTRVVDVGTGAGAPGLPLAIVRPDLVVTLVEPLAKRVAFLRTVLGTIRRTDILLERGKGEALVGRGEPWGAAIARATLPPPEWLALGKGLVAQGGDVYVLLAKEAPPEAIGMRSSDDVAYAWPNSGVARRIVRYTRE